MDQKLRNVNTIMTMLLRILLARTWVAHTRSGSQDDPTRSLPKPALSVKSAVMKVHPPLTFAAAHGGIMIGRILGIGLAASILGGASVLAGPSAQGLSGGGFNIAQASPTSDAADQDEDNSDELNEPDEGGGEPKAKQLAQTSPNTATAPTADLHEFLADPRPIESLSLKELRLKLRAGRQLVRQASIARTDKKKIRVIMRAAKAQVTKLRGEKGKKSPKAGAAQSSDTTAPSANP